MAIEHDIKEWVQTRPQWQQELFQQIRSGNEFTDTDIGSWADTVLSSEAEDSDANQPGDEPDEATRQKGLEPKTLAAVRHVAGVNQLAANQELGFANDGLNVVFGYNGAGKSGFARIIASVASPRIPPPVLHDVYAETPQAPEAFVDISMGDSKSSVHLRATQTLAQDLHFYDRACGDDYVSTDAEVKYRPSALSWIDQLLAATERIATEIENREGEIRQRAGAFTAEGIIEHTTASELVDQLTEDCSADDLATVRREIEQISQPNKDEKERLTWVQDEVTRLEATTPELEKKRLINVATNLRTLEAAANRAAPLGPGKWATAKAAVLLLKQSKLEADAANQKAAQLNQLEGVFNEDWRKLWDAAAHFSNTHAHATQDFPDLKEGTLCVLCEQPLDAAALNRMKEIGNHVASTLEQKVQEHRASVTSIQTAVNQCKPDAAVHQAVGAVMAEPEAQDLKEQIQRVTDIDNRVDEFLTSLDSGEELDWDDASAFPTTVGGDLGARAQAIAEQANLIDAASHQTRVSKLLQERNEFASQTALFEQRGEVMEQVSRLVSLKAHGEARKALKTTEITKLTSRLTQTYVSERANELYQSHLADFGLPAVSFKRGRGSKGKVMHGLSLAGTTGSVAIGDVLSEGEQTILGLAGFFTEADMDESRSALVLDDPVTSLDHRHRRTIAEKLAEIAQTRQVVIFTHDATFAAELQAHANHLDAKLHGQTVERRGPRRGVCVDKLPWSTKLTGSRINDLRVSAAGLKKQYDDDEITEEEYRQSLGSWAGELSETWEKMIHELLADKLLVPGKWETRPSMLRIAVKFDDQDLTDFEEGYGFTSRWATRHNNHSEAATPPPNRRHWMHK